MQQSPGEGAWTIDQQESWEGVLIQRPYPMLRMTRGGEVRTILLVSEGKVGAEKQAATLDGKAVRIRGTLVKRDGRHLVELVNEPDAVVAIEDTNAAGGAAPVPPLSWRRVELRGEIIDPKCYLGVMKPGEGKTHKACAALCLRGGIPPMFVNLDEAGARCYFLIVSESGEAVTGDDLDALIAHVGEAVRVQGQTATWGDMTLLKLKGSDVERD